ncbi:MAG: transcriptional repressor [Bosea sp.]|jgi:Fur family zinc uptake transcriptional regulator|nr:transcriptional repressor [Bosea sp. (in: a-proteobacteria)]
MGRHDPQTLNARAEQVLALLRESAQPLGAYELVHRLADGGDRIAPTQVYRVLGALKDAGLVLRVESRNAFIAAQHVHQPDEPVALLVCACCGKVEEADAEFIAPALKPTAQAFGFTPLRTSLEVLGECGNCRDRPG